MAEYNFYGLSWRSFEQLVQALAAKIIGPKTVIFGAGRDEGREATYEGVIKYPSSENPWIGYLVIQAKFRERPQSPGGQSDGDWALAQLRAELEAFADLKSGRRKPDYYIFATNVILTPFPEKGTKDKTCALLEEFKDRVSIKDFDIWDYDKLSAFLDDAEAIRRAYGAWITPGDVLAEMMQWFKPRTPDFDQIMVSFLQKELASDQNVRLDQAGHATDQRTPLAKVFVDLSFSSTATVDPPDEKPDEPLPPGFMARVLDIGNTRLDPQTQYERTLEGISERQAAIPGRLVLVGGSGQGKTTISQLIAQLYRAAILKDKPEWQIDPEVRPILKMTLSQCGEESIQVPIARRFPIRIVLNEFAAKLVSKDYPEVNSLLSYLLHRIKERTDREMASDDLRLWLKNYPWAILLDGFDEVPASSNRDDVLTKVREFWVDATQCNADLLVIVTTRPQGYQGEFGEVYQHLYLTPLSGARAMYYGRRFASVRHSADVDMQRTVLSRLQVACDNETTLRLMRSPLQVTIMATLVAQLGQPPRERWSLFKKYYDILYQREIAKDINLSGILLDQRENIDAIHYRVGLLLQIRSELAGGTQARLSAEDFSKIVMHRLQEEDYGGSGLKEISQRIINAAMDRLVFLVGLEADSIGFEIRSLQEWMAAEALMAADDKIVPERLRAISPVPHWRNVFLFAAGKCFVERQYLRDTILSTCHEMNESENGLERATLAGSTLALDLVEDGSARRQPKFGRMLTRLALKLLDLPLGLHHTRLADQYDGNSQDAAEIERIFCEEFRRHFADAVFENHLSTWATLFVLLAKDIPWAVVLADQYWPKDIDQQLSILSLMEEDSLQARWSLWAVNRLVDIIPKMAPDKTWRGLAWMRKISSEMRHFTISQPSWFEAILSDFYFYRDIPFIRVKGRGGFSFCYVGIRGEAVKFLKSFSEMPNNAEHWQLFIASGCFLDNPCKETLAREIRILANVSIPFQHRGWAPWPITVCLEMYRAGKEDLKVIADRIESGELGDLSDWEALENSWIQNGVTEHNFLDKVKEDWSFNDIIKKHIIPVQILTSSSLSGEHDVAVKKFLRLLGKVSKGLVRKRITSSLLFLLSGSSILKMPKLSFLQTAFEDWPAYPGWFRVLNALPWNEKINYRWLGLLDSIGKNASKEWWLIDRWSKDFLKILQQAFAENNQRVGLMRLMAVAVDADQVCHVALASLDPKRFVEPEVREAALILILSQKGWESYFEPARLATHLVDLDDKDPDLIIKPLRVIGSHLPTSGADIELLISLRYQLPPKCWKGMNIIIQKLNDQLARHTSKLDDPRTVETLQLPIPNL